MANKINTNRLKALRYEQGITQADAAKIVGCTHSTYCTKERGQYPFTLEEARRLAAYFGLSIEDTFFSQKSIADQQPV